MALGCGILIGTSRGPTAAAAEVPGTDVRVAQGLSGSFGQLPGTGTGLGFQGPGFSRPSGQNPFQSNRPGVLGAQGIQGGAFSSNSSGVVAPGRTMKLAAFCTDLLSEPPNSATRFRGGERSRITLADGRTLSLASALENGLVTMRGRNEALNPLRPGGLALSLEVVNTSPVPVRVDIPAGETVTPVGQAEQPLPSNADRLFTLAAEARLTQSNTLQYAVWAARGSTVEEVEQANMTQLPAPETRRVQELLDASGIERKFERERGAYAAKYRAVREKLSADAKELSGSASLPGGGNVEVAGLRDAAGSGLITVHREGGEFFYRAEFRNRKDGKVDVTLKHLVTGRRIHPFRGYLLVKPAA
jgi:hypothetical protein